MTGDRTPPDGGSTAITSSRRTKRGGPSTRLSIERLYQLDRLIRERRFPSLKTLAEICEVSQRTVQRDLETLRDRFQAPLAYHREHGGYAYTEPRWFLPALRISQGELVALFLAERVLRQYGGTPYEAELGRAFGKLCSYLPDEITIDLRQLDSVYSFKTTATSVQDLETFTQLTDATLKGLRIEVDYHTMYRDEDSHREIDPYHMANINGQWYLFAYCHLRKGVRVFSPSRIRSLRATGEVFRRPADFNVAEYLKDTFSVIKGDPAGGTFVVRLRFDASIARYIRERIWHPSQQLTALDDGELELRLELESLAEVRHWVLSWGSAVEVLEPSELHDWVCAEARRLLER